MKMTLAVVSLLLCSASVCAQETKEFPSTSGNAFARLCVIDIDHDGKIAHSGTFGMGCIGYVEGVVDGVRTEAAFAHDVSGKKPPLPFCLPEDVENGQIIRITLKYIRDNPEQAHKSTATLIVEGLSRAFPCRGSK